MTGQESKFAIRLSDLGLSVKLVNALNRQGAYTVRDLVGMGMTRIRRVNRIGSKAVTELTNVMNDIGVTIPEKTYPFIQLEGRGDSSVVGNDNSAVEDASDIPAYLFPEYDNLPDLIPRDSFLLALNFAFKMGCEWNTIIPRPSIKSSHHKETKVSALCDSGMISNRLSNVLRKNGIDDLKDLSNIPRDILGKMNGMGPSCMRDLTTLMQDLGIGVNIKVSKL